MPYVLRHLAHLRQYTDLEGLAEAEYGEFLNHRQSHEETLVTGKHQEAALLRQDLFLEKQQDTERRRTTRQEYGKL